MILYEIESDETQTGDYLRIWRLLKSTYKIKLKIY